MNASETDKRVYFDWFLLSLFFTYQYLLRCCPSVFTNEIRNTFAVGAGEFSNFGAWFMLAYGCLQIPFGTALDRIGIRRTILYAFALCLVGQYVFTHASSYEGALFGRVLTGIGGAPGFMGALKLIADGFPEKSRGLFIGITGMFTGAVVVVNPLLKKVCLEQNWRVAADELNFFGLAVFIACLLFLFPKKTLFQSKEPVKIPFRRALRAVATDYKVYACAAFIIGTNIVAMTLAELWGPSFLMTKFRLGEQQAVNDTQLISVGMVLGELVLPLLFCGDRMLLRGIRLCCGGLVVVFCFFVFGTHFPPSLLQTLLFLTGVFGAADVFAFTLGTRLSDPQTSGMVMSCINSIGMLGEPILQKGVGYILDYRWSGLSNENGLRIYQTGDYESALGVMLAVTVVCLLIAFCTRETEKKAKCDA